MSAICYGLIHILEIVNTAGITEEDPKSCAEAQFFADATDNIATDSHGLHFNTSSLVQATNINYPSAWSTVTFRVWEYDFGTTTNRVHGIPITYDIAGGSKKITDDFPLAHAECGDANTWGCYRSIAKIYGSAVCARDEFVIRPSSYNITLNDTVFIGGTSYNFNVTAIDNQNNTDTGYTTTIDQSSNKFISRILIPRNPGDCADSPDLNGSLLSNSLYFNAGLSSGAGGSVPTFTYNNIGDINFLVHDSAWTEKDTYKLYSGGTYSDCIIGSSSSTHENSKVGCDLKGNRTISFIADSFSVALSIQNFKEGNFTYLAKVESNTSNMYAEGNLTVKALLSTGATATNYTQSCFANDINYTIDLTQDQTLKWDTTQKRIKYFAKSNPFTTLVDNSTEAQATFNTKESIFNAGIGNPMIQFNFDRRLNTPDNPFKITNTNFNLTLVTDGTTTGSGFGAGTATNATFLYARAKPSKYLYDDVTTSSVTTPISVEVYCDKWPSSTTNCPGVDLINGQTNDFRWYISTSHDMSTYDDGNITLSATNGTVSPTVVSINSGANGIDNTIVVSGTAPNTVDIDFVTTNPTDTSDWLIYNKDSNTVPSPFYRVRPIGTGSWAGKGKTGHVVGGSSNKKKSRRVEW